MKALLLCAGYGTRLGSLTRDVPKALLPVAGRPLLDYTLAYLADAGVREVVINLHYRPEQIRTHLGDGSRFDVRVQYAYEHELLGTAGALKRLAPAFLGAGDILVVYGDLLLDQRLDALRHFHRERGAAATLLLHERRASNSVVLMDDSLRITAFHERPDEGQRHSLPMSRWVNSGVYLLSESLLAHLPDQVPADFPRDVFPDLVRSFPVYGFPLSGYRCAIDSPERLAEASAAVREGRYRAAPALTAEASS